MGNLVLKIVNGHRFLVIDIAIKHAHSMATTADIPGKPKWEAKRC